MADVMQTGRGVNQSAALNWIKLLAGLAATLGWVRLGQGLGATITVENPAIATAIYYALLFVPLIVLAALLGYLDHRPAFSVGASPGRWTVIGLAAGIAGLFVTVAFAGLNGQLVAGEAARFAAGSILLGVALTLLQVGAEEMLFRGWLQPALIQRSGPLAGVVLGAAVFAAYHWVADVAHAPLSLINLMLGGVWFGLLALRSGGLLAPIAAHLGWNALEDYGLGLVPNPGHGDLGFLADYDLLGSPLWGGHAEGLNASIGTTAVLIALILPLLRASGRPAVSAKTAPAPAG